MSFTYTTDASVTGFVHVYTTLANAPSTVSFAPGVSLFSAMQQATNTTLGANNSGTYCNENQADIIALLDTEGITAVIKEDLCSNWISNPPYKCTVYSTKSYLELISQSLAITTTSIALLFMLAKVYFSKFPYKEDLEKVDGIDSEAVALEEGGLEMKGKSI